MPFTSWCEHLQDTCEAKSTSHKPMYDTVLRGSVLIYDVEFTEQKRISGVSKLALARALSEFKELRNILPKTWLPVKALAKKKRSRKK